LARGRQPADAEAADTQRVDPRRGRPLFQFLDGEIDRQVLKVAAGGTASPLDALSVA
jgi:hypothetical protein